MIPYIFIISRNRPIYLWITLDSLYRKTSGNCNFILIDNGSDDNAITNIIKGFDKRNMFFKKYLFKDNNRINVLKTINDHIKNIGDFHFMVESDIEILTDNWNEIMIQYMKSDNYGLLGSAIDTKDFINIDKIDKNPINNFLIKANSPERKYIFSGTGVADMQPAGRITIRKTKIIADNINNPNRIYNDSDLNRIIKQEGYKTGVIKEVKHRHLSLLNYYDYSDYNPKTRNDFFKNK